MAETEVIPVETRKKSGRNGKNYKPLTLKQEKFCQGLVMGQSQVEAYKNAYNTEGYNGDAGLMVHASRLAADARVVLRVAALRVPAQEEFQKHRKAWLLRLMGMAFADVRKAFDEHGNCIDIPNLPDSIAPNVAGFEQMEEFEGKGESRVSVGYTKKVKLVPPLEAMKLFGESLQWFPGQGSGKLGLKAEIKGKDRSIKIELVSAKESTSFMVDDCLMKGGNAEPRG